jgi:hypothetical protein
VTDDNTPEPLHEPGVLGHVLLAAAALLFCWGIAVALTGGIDVRVAGVAIRSRDPFRALAASVALVSIVSVVYRAHLTALLDRLGAWLRHRAVVLTIGMAAALAAHGVVFGSFGVGGADSYGYVNQAYDWATGRLPRPIPLVLNLPFDMSDPMQAPLGYRVGTAPHTMVPTYAPGLPFLMAAGLLIAGGAGPFLVVPIAAALLVWFTYRLGTIAGGRAVGLVAAFALISSPVVLYQALWPMSDVPAGALWSGALVCALGSSRRGALAAGVWAAIGLLVRPNLLFVPAVPLLVVALGARGRERAIRSALFVAPLVPVVVFVAVLNTLWYGSPSNSGYGAARELYLLENIWPNVKLYAAWLWQSQSPWVLLALLPLVAPLTRTMSRRALAACALMCAATFASYVSYSQFEAWWYLRFLMPAAAAFAVLIAAGIVGVARRVPQPYGRLAAALALYMMTAATLSFAFGKGVFGGLRSDERRYVTIGEFAADHLPGNAILFASQHSGSLRFYSGHLTLRFDWVQKEWAGDVPGTLERLGYHPYLIVDDFELPQVRQQFGLPADATLPWPIVARMRENGGLTVFDMASRPDPAAPIALEPGGGRWYARRKNPSI